MTIATLLDFPLAGSDTRDLMLRALEPHVLLGMPHLNAHGLSETWAMKELGHRHWLMLALHLGMDDADFRTDSGKQAYAAICATSLEDAQFGDARANDILTIRSELLSVSRTQSATRHDLSIHGKSIGRVELLSTFVQRTVEGDNHSIARVTLAGPRPSRFEPSRLAQAAADARNGRLGEHFGFSTAKTTVLRSRRFEPSLSQEFNGAGLFYFAEFQAFADRAFEHWFAHDRTIAHRSIFFLGNIAQGEAVRFDLMGLSDDSSSAYGQLCREDGKVIALIFCRWKPESGMSEQG